MVSAFALGVGLGAYIRFLPATVPEDSDEAGLNVLLDLNVVGLLPPAIEQAPISKIANPIPSTATNMDLKDFTRAPLQQGC